MKDSTILWLCIWGCCTIATWVTGEGEPMFLAGVGMLIWFIFR